MKWFMGLKDNNVVGWSNTAVAGYIEVTPEIRTIHETNPDYIWDGTTLVAPPTPVAYVPDPVEVEAQRIAQLWQSAHDYEYNEISGSAIGLLAMGVIQGKPKCLAVQNWIKSIWTLYYVAKAGTATTLDLASVGACPYAVPELMAELGL